MVRKNHDLLIENPIPPVPPGALLLRSALLGLI